MTAWSALLAASTLLAGTAWQLLTSPRTGTVVNDGIVAEISTMHIDIELADTPVLAEVADSPITVELSTEAIEVEITE